MQCRFPLLRLLHPESGRLAMMKGERPEWLGHFPELATIEEPVVLQMLVEARQVTLPAGTVVYREGDPCVHFLLVVEGAVRVQKLSEGGREIVLYRVESGQSCILTTSCLLGGGCYGAEGVTESQVEAVTIPLSRFRSALDISHAFREFVFNSYGRRVAELITLIDAVAFGRIDLRLASTLLELADQGGLVETTHQMLAAELGTAREVISRQLKEFERREWVALGRGRVIIRQRNMLEKMQQGR
jgi:CRP/FNR family transcriptional regulator